MKFFKQAEPQFNTQRAVMTIVFGAMTADGEVEDEEITRLRSMCARSPIFASNSKDEDDAVIRWVNDAIDRLGNDALSTAAEALTPELRETAFAFACEMVLADGIVGQDEERYIGKIAEALDIGESVGSAIVNVTMIRLRGAA